MLFDPDANRAAKLKLLFGEAGVTTDFAVITGSGIDLAIVASPPRFHADQAIELLTHGIAVLCEKPMAATVAECEQMVRAAEKSRKPLAVGLFRRFFPVNQTIREMIRNQSLGPVKSFEISEGGQFNWPAQSASFFQKSKSQGGVLSDLGVHVLDVLIWWFGMPERVDYQDDAMGGLESNCRLELEFRNGVSGTVQLSRDTSLPNRTIVEFERGWVRCKAVAADEFEIGFPGVPYAARGRLLQPGAQGPHGFRTQPALSYHQSFTKQMRNVVAAVRGEEPVFISGEDGILSMQLIERCYRQRKLMPMPWLTESESQTAQMLAGIA
jgi:predicted dehydrogenase